MAEVFTGVRVEHVKAVPAADGTELGISFLPPEGEPISVIISQESLENILTEVARGAHRCQERFQSQGRPRPRLRP